MTRRAQPATSWADTGRYTPPPKRERLRDLATVAACLRAGRPIPPLLARWLADAIEELGDVLAAGGRANLHRLLNLPDRNPVHGRRLLFRKERDHQLRAVAAALPAELPPWRRALELARLLDDHGAAGPPEARGHLAYLRHAGVVYVPRSPRMLLRIIKTPCR